MHPFQHAASAASPATVFGPGASARVGEQGPLKKCARILVVTDATVRKAGLLDGVQASLKDRVALVDDAVVADGDADHVDRLAAAAKEKAVDAICAVGGGSVIDTAKAVGACLIKGAPIRSLEGIATVRAKLLPLVAVPTTSGTGSEATQFAVIKDRAAHKKLILMDLSLVPAQAVLDPALLASLPKPVTAATGVDAITHAVEALASLMKNPVATSLATEALVLLVRERALERALGGDDAARGDCLVAAHLAGMAINTAMLGACHAFAHALGAHKGVAHGVANGVFLLPVVEANLKKATPAYARAGRALGASGDDAACAAALVEQLRKVVHDVAGIPTRLSSLGVSSDDVDTLTAGTLADADLGTNPVRLDETAVRALLAARM